MNDFFSPAGEGSVEADLTGYTWRIMLYLDELDELLGPEPEIPEHPLDALAQEAEAPVERPEDPVMARLLPEGFLDQGEGADAFRQFTHRSLLVRKRADAKVMRELLTDVVRTLDPAAARQVLGCLNDLRLMLGTRLLVAEQGEFHGEDLTDLAAYQTYLLLGWLQEELVDALT